MSPQMSTTNLILPKVNQIQPEKPSSWKKMNESMLTTKDKFLNRKDIDAEIVRVETNIGPQNVYIPK